MRQPKRVCLLVAMGVGNRDERKRAEGIEDRIGRVDGVSRPAAPVR